MNKVTLFFLVFLITGCNGIKQLDIEGIKGTKIATSENQIVIESIVQNVRLSERSEVFSLKPLTDFILKIDQLKINSQSYKRYGPSKN